MEKEENKNNTDINQNQKFEEENLNAENKHELKQDLFVHFLFHI